MAELQRSKSEAKRGSWIQEAFSRASVAGGRSSLVFGDSDKSGGGNSQAPPPGSTVLVGNQQSRGIVRFVGSTNFASGIWVGVELDSPHGRNDGSVKGMRYFECKALHGIFVRPSAVQEEGGDSQLGPSASLPVLTSMSSFNDIDDESDYEDKPQASSQRSSLLDIDEQDWASLGSKLSQHLRSGRRESLRRKRSSDSGSFEDAAGVGPGTEPSSEAGGAEASKTSSSDLAELVAAQKEGATNELISSSTGTPRATPRRRRSGQPVLVETEEVAPSGPSAKPSRPPRNSQTLEIPTTRQSRSRPVSPSAEAPVMFSKGRSTVDLSPAGGRGPAALDGDALLAGVRSRRSTIDLTVLRKQAQQAQQEKQLREKELPRATSPTGQQGLLQESWRPQHSSESNCLQVPESPASPVSLGSPGNVLALSKPLSPTEPLRSPRQSPRPSFAHQMQEIVPISASDHPHLAEERSEAQHLLAQAMEDHDVEQLRRLLPRAIALGVGAEELECAQQILHFEVQRSLLHEIDDVRTCVAVLSEAVQKAEERAVAAERNSELSNERLTLSRGANDRSSKLSTPPDEAWLGQLVDRLERKVWEGLEWRVETLRTSVTTATSELLSAVNEIKQLPRSLFTKHELGTSGLPAGFQASLQGTLTSPEQPVDADCDEQIAGCCSRGSSGPPSQQAAEEERAEELRVLGEALSESAAASPRPAKPPLAPSGPTGRVRSRSPAAAGGRQKALLEKDAAVCLQKVERGRQARKRASSLRQLPHNALLHGRRGHAASREASPNQGSMVREEIRQAAATVIQRGFRRLRSRSIESSDGLLRPERSAEAHGGQCALEGLTMQFIKLVVQEGELRLGFVPSGLPPDRIFVESVDPNSWSMAQGVWEGDELIEVGGQEVLRMSRKDFTNEIKKRPLHLTFVRDSQPGSSLRVGSRRPSSSSATPTTSRRPSSTNTGNTGGCDADANNEVTYLAVSGHFGQADSGPMGNMSSDGHRSPWSSTGGGQSPRAASPDRCDSPPHMDLTLGSSGGALLAEAEPDSPLRLTLQPPVDQSPRTRNNPLGVGPRQNVHRTTGNILLALPSGDREAVDGVRRQRSPLEELADSRRLSATSLATSPRAGGRSPTPRSPMRSPRSPAEFLASLLQGSPHQMSPSSSGTAQSPQKVGVHPASPASPYVQSPQKGKTEIREPRASDTAELVQSPQKPRSASTEDTDSLQKGLEGSESPPKAKRLELEALDADQRLGFKPWGLPPDRIYVTEVDDGLWADLNGVVPGDELVACNRQDVVNMRPRDLVAAMKARPLHLSFVRDPQSGFTLPVDSRRPSASSNTLGTSPRPSLSNTSNAGGDNGEGTHEDSLKRNRFRSRSSRLLGHPSPRTTPGPSRSQSPRGASPAPSGAGVAESGACQADSLSPTPPPTDSSLRLSLTPKDDSSSRSLSQLETSAAMPSESPSGIAYVAEKRAWSESPSSPKFAIQSDLGDSMRSRVSLQFPSDCGSPEWPHGSPGKPFTVGSPQQPVSPRPASHQTSSTGCPAVGEPGWPAAGGDGADSTSPSSLSDALFGEKAQECDDAEPILQDLQPEPSSLEPPGSAPEPDEPPPSFSFGPPHAAAAVGRAAPAIAAVAKAPEPAEPLAQSLTNFIPGPEGAEVPMDEEALPQSLPPKSDKLVQEQRVADIGSTLDGWTTTTDTTLNWPPEDQEFEEMEHF